jgi:hypothetical protein
MERLVVRQVAAMLGVVLALGIVPAMPANADDLPAPGVARLSLVGGDVAIQRADADGPSAAAINAPLLAGDVVSTGDAANAEVQFDSRTMLRFDQDAQVRITSIDPARREAQLAGGTIDLRTFAGFAGTDQIDTPSVSVRPDGAGSIRITVADDGSTAITVRAGRAQILTPQSSIALVAGNTLIARGDAAAPSIDYASAPPVDAFDQFCGARDRDATAGFASAYVNPNIAFVDFARYGRWVFDPRYGEVWVPNGVGPDWAPYRFGRFVWEDGYGWTWVSDEPWGWAPYHYGRWYYSTSYGGWCWYPPPVAVRPVWAPALVGFFTFGNVSVGVGFGNIAWVPLAPYEVYHPWYGWSGGRFGPTIVNNVTITNINITRVYVNVSRPGAVTGLPGTRFTEGRFERPQPVAIAAIGTAQAVHGALPIVPTERNLTFSTRSVPPALANRTATLVEHHSFAGPPVLETHRTPFVQQRSLINAHLTAPPATSAPDVRPGRGYAPGNGLTPPPAFRTPPAYRTPPPAFRTPPPSYRTPPSRYRPAAVPTIAPTAPPRPRQRRLPSRRPTPRPTVSPR